MAQLFWLSGQQLSDGNGAPYIAAKAYFYETGSTTPKATYSNAGLTSANANPVVADANGRFGDIYLVAGRYKVVLTTSADVAIDTLDPVDATQQLFTRTALQGLPGAGDSYPFMRVVVEDAVPANSVVYRRNAANSAWITEGTADSLLNAADVSEVLTGTLASKAVTPDALAGLWQRGDIPSNSTLSLPATGGGVFLVTGATGISAISTGSGGRRVSLRFAGALTLTHSANLILPGGVSIVTQAGDVAEFINDAAQDATGSNWRCVNYQRASGSPVNNADFIATQADMEAASSTTALVTAGRARFHPSASKAWVKFVPRGTNGACTVNASYNVASVDRTAAGAYTITFTTAMSSANYVANGNSQSTSTANNLLIIVNAQATTNCQIYQISASAGGGNDLGDAINVTCYGDQ
jgi:hypothetical protein